MTSYWPKRLGQVPESATQAANKPSGSKSKLPVSDDEDDYDRARRERLRKSQSADGWRTELAQYLTNPCLDVSKYEDTVNWWQVRLTFLHLWSKFNLSNVIFTAPCNCLSDSSTYGS